MAIGIWRCSRTSRGPSLTSCRQLVLDDSFLKPQSSLVRMPRDAFEGYDEPVNIDMDPEDALKLLLANEKVEVTREPVEGDE